MRAERSPKVAPKRMASSMVTIPKRMILVKVMMERKIIMMGRHWFEVRKSTKSLFLTCVMYWRMGCGGCGSFLSV